MIFRNPELLFVFNRFVLTYWLIKQVMGKKPATSKPMCDEVKHVEEDKPEEPTNPPSKKDEIEKGNTTELSSFLYKPSLKNLET